jgi:hypothetical protein
VQHFEVTLNLNQQLQIEVLAESGVISQVLAVYALLHCILLYDLYYYL